MAVSFSANVDDFRRTERHEWYLWSAVLLVTLLLTLSVASLVFPLPVRLNYREWWNMRQAVIALIGLVLLFDVYSLHQLLKLHRTRRQLLARDELFRVIGQSAADMIAVVDSEGHRLYNSPAYQRVLGYSVEELAATSAYEQVHPDDREKVKAAALEAKATGIGRPLEYRMRHKDGTWLTLESAASVVNTQMTPEPVLVIVNRDVTARKQAEEALRASEAAYRLVVEEAPVGIFRCNAAGEVQTANRTLAALLGHDDASQLLGLHVANFYQQPADHEGVARSLAQSERLAPLECEWKRRDGGPITVRLYGRRGQQPSGAEYFEIFVEDVSESRRLQQQLLEAQKLESLGRLAGGVAHDFNNILGVIIGFSERLEEKERPFPEVRSCGAEIRKASQNAAGLTRQLLAFSRQQVLAPKALDLNAVIADMEEMLHRILGEDIELTTVSDPELPHVQADESQLQQVLLNLVANARDAMPHGGTVKVDTAHLEVSEDYARQNPPLEPGVYAVLMVTDNGIGMDAETKTHIFEPFFSTKARDRNTGLGLATVSGIVRQSGGHIRVRSELGAGSTFEIYLPQAATAAAAADATAAASPARGRETILLVEDAETLRMLSRDMLKEHGYRILEAVNADDAVRLAHTYGGNIDLLLTDIIMPGANGVSLADYLVSLRPRMRVLFISGYTDGALARRGIGDATRNLLQKPFTQRALAEKVREVLEAAPEQRDASDVGPSMLLLG